MKVLGVALLVASLLPAGAQVTVEVTQEQNQFLQGEALAVAVRITNRSGQTLRLGAEADWLSFSIEAREGSSVGKTGDVPVQGEFELESSQVATKRVDLMPYFTPMGPGHYGIVATIHVKEWNREISSTPKYFDVIEGAKLWEQEVGVPISSGETNSVPEVRRFILQQANYLRGQIRLYLRVTDNYGKTYRVFPVGGMVSFSRPEPQVDKFCHLHVLFQTGAISFSYSVFDFDGMVLARQTFDYQGTRPRLRMDDDGTVYVLGGTRRVTPGDVPRPAIEDSMKPAGTNSAASTNSPVRPKS
jgi:hypothetical protein